MKQLTYILRVNNVDSPIANAWDEDMNVSVGDDVTAEEHGRKIIDSFNNSLRPFEKPRVFISARELGTEENIKVPLMHTWSKKSLVTEKGGFDKYICTTCGFMGKRHGVSATVVVDKKHKNYTGECRGFKK